MTPFSRFSLNSIKIKMVPNFHRPTAQACNAPVKLCFALLRFALLLQNRQCANVAGNAIAVFIKTGA